MGPDTFTISTSASPGKGGVPAAKRIAYEEAGAECSRRGNFEVYGIKEQSASPTWTEGMAKVDLTFKCLPKDDPEFKRYDQLAKLKQLLDSGALTQEEYQAEKQKLLSNTY